MKTNNNNNDYNDNDYDNSNEKEKSKPARPPRRPGGSLAKRDPIKRRMLTSSGNLPHAFVIIISLKAVLVK